MTNPPRTLQTDIAVIGGGPAGLMAAEVASKAGRSVAVFDAMPSMGRKFLMAGRGGLNITHSEPMDRFLTRYGSARPLFERLLARFTPADLRAWCEGLGVKTFVGSSGRVFPDSFKASILLRAWLNRLSGQGVTLHPRHRWTGWTADGQLSFTTPDGPVEVRARAVVLALGGASWPRLGSDGGWAPILAERGVAIAPFRPSNSGIDVPWTPAFLERAEGMPLKRIALTHGPRTVKGELIITRTGLEGGAVYALSASLRDALDRMGAATLHLDLKPDLTEGQVAAKLGRTSPNDSLANRLRKGLSLEAPVGTLLREFSPAEALTAPLRLAALLKALPIPVAGMRGLDRAISSAGGISLCELDDLLMLKELIGVFACGEMLDWEAPTGGYLLQGCFATGHLAGEGAAAWVGANGTV